MIIDRKTIIKSMRMKNLIFFKVFLCLIFSVKGFAFPWPSSDESETNNKAYTAHHQIKNESKAEEETEFYKFQIYTQSMKFFTEEQTRQFTGAHLRLKHPMFSIKASYTYSTSIYHIYSIYENYHYFRPYQFNFNFNRPDGKWIIGRMPMEWDWADSFWNKALWQPAYTDDALRPQQAGLTGLFREFRFQGGGRASLFGSFIFLPDGSPPFENKNGKITSENPWFTPPPSNKMGDSRSVLAYKLKESSFTDLLKLSLGINAEYEGFYLSYAYKPMNKVKIKGHFSFPLHKELRGNFKDGYLLDVPVETVILKHHLFSGGFTLDSANQKGKAKQNTSYRLKTSFTYNHPEEHTLESEEWVFFQPRNEWHISLKGEIHVKDPYEETTLHAGYTHLFYPSEEKKNLLSKVFPGIKKQFFRDDLFQFSRAGSVGIDHKIKFEETQEIQIKARLIYHLLKEYFLFSAHFAWTFEEAFSVFLSSDLLFSEFPFSAEQTQEDIGIYTNKSRVFGGISYEF